MATNLVSFVMQFLTPDTIAKIASALGVDRMITQKAITGAVPAILSGLAGVAWAPGGARQLSNAISQQQPGLLDSLQSLIGGSGQKALADSGTGMMSSLLGGGTMDALTQSVGRFAGMSESASKPLLGLLGPVVMGALGQQQRSAGLDANRLASLLASQKQQIALAIPSGLADRLSASGLMDNVTEGLRGGTAAGAAASRMGDAAQRTVAGASQAAYGTTNQAAYAARSAASTRWPIWAIGAIVLAGLAWYLFSRTGEDKVAVTEPAATTQPASPQPAHNAAPPAASTDRVMDTAPAALATPSLTVGGVNLATQVNSTVGGLKSALAGINDTASARAAMPKIRDAIAQLDEVQAQSMKLPAEGKSALARLIAASIPTINQLCDRALATPGVEEMARPSIDELRGRLDTLARA